jgi:hypothetical protein
MSSGFRVAPVHEPGPCRGVVMALPGLYPLHGVMFTGTAVNWASPVIGS